MVDNEQDRMLPIANVGRIMKQVLPARAKISKEAKQTMQDCATEFLSFVTGEASDKCHKENRKTVNGDDICWALSALGFDNYAQATLTFLHKYREAERDKAASTSASASVANNQNINKPQHQIKLKHHQPSHEVKQVEEKSHQTPNLEFRMLHEKGHEDYN